MKSGEQDVKTDVSINISNLEIDFNQAQKLAKAVSATLQEEPMLVAWFDRASDRFFPNITCCDLGDGRASWEIYADSRGAQLRVDVNEGITCFFSYEPTTQESEVRNQNSE